MKNFTLISNMQVKTSTNLSHGATIRSIKYALSLLVLLFTLGVGNAWGFTSTSSGDYLKENFNSSSHSVTWTANHVTFKLSGDGNAMYTAVGHFYISNGKTYSTKWYIPATPHNDGATHYLSWTVESGYDICVTKVTLDIDRASGGNSYITVGNGSPMGDLFFGVPDGGVYSGTMSLGNTETMSIVFPKATSWSTVAVNSIKVEYTMTPQISTSNGSVEVTICDDNKKTIELSNYAYPVDNSGHLSATYSITAVSAAANTSATTSTGYISGSTFYATQAGTYTIQIAVAAKSNCHNSNSKTFTVTVNPATLSLTAPTATDIYYPSALSASTLSGGSASVGSCSVDGTWAWENASTVPSVGDNQSFPVIFTPSENTGNYTGFETNATLNVLAFIFDGSGDSDDKKEIWSKGDNWNVNITPTIDNIVIIRHDVIIEDEVSAYSVTIDDGYKVTIAPTGGLTVGAGGISGATVENLKLQAGTPDNGFVIGQTGYLRISPEYKDTMPQASVELYSIGYYDYSQKETGNVAAWQYVGSPLACTDVLAKTVYKKSWVYTWSEEDETWSNTRSSYNLKPFEGFSTTQRSYSDGMLMTYTGQLVSTSGTVEVDLDYSGEGKGDNIMANSFTAPIDITKFEASDFVNVEPTIYLFNTGSKDAAAQASEVNDPGQFNAIPVNTAKALATAKGTPTVIAPMQGFFVTADSAGAKVYLNYNKLVWNGDYAENPNSPLRISSRIVDETDTPNDTEEEAIVDGALGIGLVAEGGSDHLFMLQSESYATNYERGYDAKKMMSSSMNIFTIEEDSTQLAVDATNSIIGTRIGVRTGSETAYTLSFSNLRSEIELALYDAETEQTIDIYEDTQYTFFAATDTIVSDRFMIVAREDAPSTATGVDNTENGVKVHKFIKDNQLFILKNGVLYDALGKRVR